MASLARWRSTWDGLGLAAPEGLYPQICLRYQEPHRAYHTLRHLEECFSHFDGARHLAQHAAEVELALWFHDAIYDPHAADCEEQSAAWAARALSEAGAAAAPIERITSLVLATKHAGSASSPDQAVLLDTDLSILGAPRKRFIEYEAQVRSEYAFVPEEGFRAARRAILARFLERPRIYLTDHFAGLLEEQARANLRFSLARAARDTPRPEAPSPR
jgi:predicted metal-dependent HD superfamily phosphohydrolase